MSETDLLQDAEQQFFREHEGRGIHAYGVLLGCDIVATLDEGDCWVDLGPDRDVKALRALDETESRELVAVSTIELNAPSRIRSYRCIFPGGARDLARHWYSSKLVTDVFGPVSFAHDPIAVVLAATMFVGPRGRLRAVTERLRFGCDDALERLDSFLRERRGMRLRFKPVTGPARYKDGDEEYIRLVVEADSEPLRIGLPSLLTAARAVFGEPDTREVLWRHESSGVVIRQARYPLRKRPGNRIFSAG